MSAPKRRRRSRRFTSPFVDQLLLEPLEPRQLLSGEVTPLINLTTPTYFQESNTFTVSLDNGIPDATFTVGVIGDNNTVQYSFATQTTDDVGHASVQLQMPAVLGPNYTVDGRTISVTQGDTTQNFAVTVHAGLHVDVTTPPTFREGDTFTVNLNNGIPNTDYTIGVIGDNNTVQYAFAAQTTDDTGHASAQLQMPYVLADGYTIDGRTIRVSQAGTTQDFAVTLHEGFRVSISTDNLTERQAFTATARNGVGNSQIIFQFLQNGNLLKEYGYRETDGSGSGTYQLTVPDVLQNGNRIDAFTFRTIQGGHTSDKDVTVSTWKPVVNIYTPPNFREGDVFSTTVMDATPGQSVGVQVIGDNNSVQYTFAPVTVDSNGNATLPLRMGFVLPSGVHLDGRTLRVTVGDYTQDFPVTLNEGQRVSLSTNNIQEGKDLTVTVTNGVGQSQVIIQLTRDGQVVNEWNYMQTDGSGYGQYKLTIPQVLTGNYTVDGFGLRVIHGGVCTDQKITITEGLKMVVSAKNVKQGVSVFHFQVRNGPANSTVTLKWYLDDSPRSTPQTFKTDGSGYGDFTVQTPSGLITNSASSDTFRLVGTVGGQSCTFKMTVYKSTTPSAGSAQTLATSPTANQQNSAPYVPITTPAVAGISDRKTLDQTQDPTNGINACLAHWNESQHQLVILCYGADEVPGQTDPKTGDDLGMDQVYSNIQASVYPGHILRLRSGDKPVLSQDPSYTPEVALKEAETRIQAILERLQNTDQRIDSIVIAGYSWGGGMAQDLANYITDVYNKDPKHSNNRVVISGLAYIDAVANNNAAGRDVGEPHVKPLSILNLIQTHASIPEDAAVWGWPYMIYPDLPGYDGTGFGYYGRFREIDVDMVIGSDGKLTKQEIANHLTIDNKEAPVVSKFILDVLHGWYDTKNLVCS